MPLKVVVYGVGPIGSLIAKTVLGKKGLELVGAIDIDPEKIDRDVGELIGLNEKVGVKVSGDADKTLRETKPDVVLHATRSYLDQIYPDIVKSINVDADFISTCETLAYPWYRYRELAILIDEMAKRHGVRVLGTGVNPGYRFDTLVGLLTAVCIDVDRINVVLSLDAAKRRYSFQKKIGLGMKPDEFKEALSKGLITAHVGYTESALLLASMLGIKLDKVVENQEAIIADKHYETKYFKIEPGMVRGIRGYSIGYIDDTEFVKLELIAAVGVDEYEEILIEGEPTIRWRNENPLIPGDIATAAMIVNVIPRVRLAPPGLLTMKDIILPTAVLGDITEWKLV